MGCAECAKRECAKQVHVSAIVCSLKWHMACVSEAVLLQIYQIMKKKDKIAIQLKSAIVTLQKQLQKC